MHLVIHDNRDRPGCFTMATEQIALRCRHDLAGGEAFRMCRDGDPGGFHGRRMWGFTSGYICSTTEPDDIFTERGHVGTEPNQYAVEKWLSLQSRS
jgi:hypothetical protein